MYKIILKLSLCLVLPLLIGSVNSEITEKNIENNRDYYEVIGATTGRKIEEKLYSEKRVIETHLTAVSAIKKAFANEGINPTSVKVLLYYDGLTISDSAPARMLQTKAHPNTISSPWLDLTKTVTTSGETRITIRIDATAARLLSDLYSKPEDKSNQDDFLSIPSIKQSCYFKVSDKYEKYGLTRKLAASKVREIYSCAPEELREPLLSLFKSSNHFGVGTTFPAFSYSVHNQLFLHCQDEAEEYYSDIYSQLAIQGLQILKGKFNPESKWWTEIIDCIKPVQECQT